MPVACPSVHVLSCNSLLFLNKLTFADIISFMFKVSTMKEINLWRAEWAVKTG